MTTASSAAVPSRGHKKRARTRSALMAAGLRALAAKGEALTVSDVVAEAGVSNGTFYNYFVDREALLDALAAQLASALAAQADEEVQTDDPALRFATVSARVLARAAADPTWGRVVLRLETLRDDAQEQTTRHLRGDLDHGLALGRFTVGADEATVDLVGAMLMMTIRRIVAGRATRGYAVDAISRVLCALGVGRAESRELASRALEDAGLSLD